VPTSPASSSVSESMLSPQVRGPRSTSEQRAARGAPGCPGRWAPRAPSCRDSCSARAPEPRWPRPPQAALATWACSRPRPGTPS
jgi:hypothetical protein